MPDDITPDLFYSFASRIAHGDFGHYFYSLHENYFYFYENGYWVPFNEIQFLGEIQRKIINLVKYPISMRKQVTENFKHIRYLKLDELNKLPLINFENYMYDPVDDNVLAHKEDFYSTIRIPYKYDAFAKCDLWLKTLNEIFQGNKQKESLLQEFYGYCLVPDMEQKKALLLLGETDTGKSTLLFILKDLLGQMNCSSVPLQYLSNPQYTPLLINRMVNIDADVSRNAGDYEREFKVITSGETVSCNQKHIPTFEFIPKCKIILAANIFPKIKDHSSAFYQRLMLIPCERRFSEQEKNRNLHRQLTAELSGIFNWALEGLRRFKKRGQFEQHGFMINAVQELEDENNPSNLFFDEHVEISMGDYVEKGELYDKYVGWTFKNKNFALSAARFSTAVYKKYHASTFKDAQDFTTRKRIWKNLKYVQFKSMDIKHDIEIPSAGIPQIVQLSDQRQGETIWG